MASVDQALLGTETVRAMRSRGVNSRVCGLSANDIEANFLSAGADMFLIKPFPCKQDELNSIFAQFLAKRGADNKYDNEASNRDNSLLNPSEHEPSQT